MRRGADYTHGRGAHSFERVYSEVVLQLCAEYPGLPDYRTMRESELRMFYDAIRGKLRTITRPSS